MLSDNMNYCLCSSPVVAMVWEGKEAVKTGRKMLGATNPLASEPGTIRGDFAIGAPCLFPFSGCFHTSVFL